MSTSFPVQRSIRRQEIIAAEGQVLFAPTEFKVWDVRDIRVRTRKPGRSFVTRPPGTFLVELNGDAPNFIELTLAVPCIAGEVVRIEGARVPERVTDVTLAGILRGAALETELDKVAVTQQEARRDFDETSEKLDAIDDVRMLIEHLIPAADEAVGVLLEIDEARDEVAANRGIVDGARNDAITARDTALAAASTATSQAGTATAQAVIAANQAVLAQNAVAAGRVRKNLLSELNASLGYPAGAQGEVTADTAANNGLYEKSGASGSGAWTKISDWTIAALGAISDLHRATRYYGRPGLDIAAWTGQVNASPLASSRLAVAGVYSLGASDAGPALIITGEASVGPNVLTWIEPGKLYRVTFRIQLKTADPTASGFRPRGRVFDKDMVDQPGTIATLPNQALTLAGNVVTYSYTVSTVAGAADYLFPLPAGGWFRPYVITMGAGGVFAVIEIQQPAEIVVTAGPLQESIADDMTVQLLAADGKTPLRITGAKLNAQIEAKAMPKQYPFEYATVLGVTPQPVLDYDPSRTYLYLFNPSLTATIIVNIADGEPVDGAADCYKLLPQSGIKSDLFSAPLSAIRAKADAPGAPLVWNVVNQTGLAPDTDIFLSYMPVRVAAAERLRISLLRGSLMSCGFLGAMDLVDSYVNTYSDNILVNWANYTGPKAVLGGATLPVFTANAKLQGNDAGYIDTNIPLLATGKYQRDRNSMFTLTDTVQIGPSRFACGFGGGGIQSNRSATQVGVRSSTASSTLVTIGTTYARWHGFCRRDALGFTVYRDDLQPVYQVEASTTQTSRNLLGLAINGSSGAAQFSNAAALALCAGRDVPDAVQAAARVAFLAHASSAGAV